MDFFDTEEKRKLLKTTADSWIGTPFKFKTCVKKKGVDCVFLVRGILHECGVPTKLNDLPEYCSDWSYHNSYELMYEEIIKRIKVKEIYNFYKHGKEKRPVTGFINGDILLFRFMGASSHTGIFADGYFYHALQTAKVIKSLITENMWHSRLTYILRIQR